MLVLTPARGSAEHHVLKVTNHTGHESLNSGFTASENLIPLGPVSEFTATLPTVSLVHSFQDRPTNKTPLLLLVFSPYGAMSSRCTHARTHTHTYVHCPKPFRPDIPSSTPTLSEGSKLQYHLPPTSPSPIILEILDFVGYMPCPRLKE